MNYSEIVLGFLVSVIFSLWVFFFLTVLKFTLFFFLLLIVLVPVSMLDQPS